MRIELAAVVALATLVIAAPARAELPCVEARDASQSEVIEAREAFVAGSEAARAGRWRDALRHFTRSYALTGASASLYNAARALEELGRDLEARDAYDCVLAHPRSLDAATLGDVREHRNVVDELVPRLILEGLPDASDSVIVELDGRAADDRRRPLVIAIDAGEHALRVERPGAEVFRWAGTLEPSERLVLTLPGAVRATHRREPLRPAPIEPPVDEGDRSIAEEPAFWIAIGAVVVAGTVAGIAVASSAGIDPRTDVVHEL